MIKQQKIDKINFEEIKSKYKDFMETNGMAYNFRTRKTPIIFYNQALIYLIFNYKNNKQISCSLKEIGVNLGKKDHSTIINSIRQVSDKLYIKDADYKKAVDNLKLAIFENDINCLDNSDLKLIKEFYCGEEIKIKMLNVYEVERAGKIEKIEIKHNKVNYV